MEQPAPATSEPLKSYRTIFSQEVRQAVGELKRPGRGLLVSALLAGFGVGVSLFLMAVAHTLAADELPETAVRLLEANLYTVGFIIVILGRTDLFTEYTTLAILPVLTGDAPLTALARLWGLVYLGNLVGAALFGLLVVVLGPALGVIEVASLSRIAREVTDSSWWVILLSAGFAGWLMGLLSWLVTAARETISQAFFIWLITLVLGLGGLHHSITGTAEVVSGLLTSDPISPAAAGHFLLWTTVGNALGGILFAVLVRYSMLHPAKEAERRR